MLWTFCSPSLKMLQHFQGCVITETPNWETGFKINSKDTQQSGRKHDQEKRYQAIAHRLITHQLVFFTLGHRQQTLPEAQRTQGLPL